MSEEKKEGGCCGGSSSTGGSCCGVKKIIFAILFGILIFISGMWFAKSCPMGKSGMCPISSQPK